MATRTTALAVAAVLATALVATAAGYEYARLQTSHAALNRRVHVPRLTPP